LDEAEPAADSGHPGADRWGGERKTLRYTAQYADIWHGFGDAATIKHKCSVLDKWCEKIGRDPAEIERSTGVTRSPEEVADDLIAAGATLFTIGIAGPNYDFTLIPEWVAWRDEYNRKNA